MWVDSWDGEAVTKLWSAIWEDMDPFMRTETARTKNNVNSTSYHKSRKGQVSCLTIYEKIGKAGLLEGNKQRKRRKTNNVKIEQAFESRKAKVVAKKRAEHCKAEARANQLTNNILRPLIPTEAKAAQDAIYGTGPDTDVVVGSGSNTVTWKGMSTLKPKVWLNDEVINYYFKTCLAKRDKQICAGQPGRNQSHFFNSLFIRHLLDEFNTTNPQLKGRYNYDKVA